MAKKKAKAVEAAPKAAKPAMYDVLINNGNDGAIAVASLDEIGAVLKAKLVDAAMPRVSITVIPKRAPNADGTAMARLDGVKS